MTFRTISGKILFNLDNIYTNFYDFNNSILQKLKENIENKDNIIIKYIYNNHTIDSTNYNDFIKDFDNTTNITIIFQKLQKNYSTDYAFAVINNNGNVITWGNPNLGGDSSKVHSQLLKTNIVEIYSTSGAFAAINEDGNIINWGNPWYGGNSSNVQSELQNII